MRMAHTLQAMKTPIVITEIFFVPTLYGIDVNDVWFQHDGETCHTSQATIDLLRQKFNVHLIS